MAKRRRTAEAPNLETSAPAGAEVFEWKEQTPPFDADPPERRREPQRLGLVLERVLRRLGVQASPWLEQLAESWPRLAPPEIARVTRPGKWDGGILYVYVAGNMQLFDIRRRHLPALEAAVRRFAGDVRVRAVRLMIDPG